MARIPAPPQAVDTMSAAQLDRRRRVLDAVIELVAAGRVDDWGMKDVAERSGVALGTIYRYFSSKDHVAAAALLEWARTLDAGRAVRRSGGGAAGPAGRAGSGTDRGRTGAGGRTAADSSGGDGSGGDGGPAPMADRLVAILRRAVRAYQQQPAFARLVMMTATSTDPFASECYAAMGASVYATLGEALDELEPDERRRVLDVVGAVWYQALIEWVNDRKTIAQVHEALESAARLVLAGYTPT
jgi:TetR/AcrR family transcriptional regulator, cholesterol catabolism regulator